MFVLTLTVKYPYGLRISMEVEDSTLNENSAVVTVKLKIGLKVDFRGLGLYKNQGVA